MTYYPTKRYILTSVPNYLLIQMRPYREFFINKDAFTVLSHIGYGADFEQIMQGVCVSRDSENILLDFLNMQVKEGILDTKVHDSECCIRLKSRPKGLALERIFCELTQRCNFLCMHCYMSASNCIDTSNELSYEEICDIIDQADSMGIYRIDFTGGEVFTRKDFISILEYATKKFMVTNIFTNGYFLTHDVCKRLNELGNIRTVFISLDDHRAEQHDRFRGMVGSFERVVNAVTNLKRIGIHTVINVTINNVNSEHILETLQYCNSCLKTETRIAPILNIGRGKCFGDQPLNQDNIFLAMQTSLKDKFTGLTFSSETNQDLSPSCGVGQKMLYIRANGEVCLCPTLSSREHLHFKLGDVRQTSIEQIWFESPFRHVFSNINCENKKCKFFVICRGGCRSRAYLQANKLDDKDKLICAFLEYFEQQSLSDSLSYS